MSVDPSLPGAELVDQGLADLQDGRWTPEALLLLIAAPRLRRLGLDVPARTLDRDAELELYDLLTRSGEADPFSAYNGLLRRVVSFSAALEARHGRALRAGRASTAGPEPGS